MTVLFEPILALQFTYYQFFKLTKLLGGGGGQNDRFAPPPIVFMGWGGGATATQLPQDRRLWGQATWTSKGGCIQWRIQDLHQKKGWAGKSVGVAHRAPHTGGVQGPAVGPLAGCRGKAPAGGPGGGAPGTSRVFSK